MKVKVIEKHYQLTNSLIKLAHTSITSNLKKLSTWKIQLAVSVNFISSKDDNDE